MTPSMNPASPNKNLGRLIGGSGPKQLLLDEMIERVCPSAWVLPILSRCLGFDVR